MSQSNKRDWMPVLADVTRYLWAILLFPLLMGAQPGAERLSDADVKVLIAQVDEGRDIFEGSLDGKFKDSMVPGPNGPIKVSSVLQDYEDNIRKLSERFGPGDAGGSEVATVLNQSTAIDAFMRQSAPATKGRGEWDRQKVNLRHLAGAYGISFPMAAGDTAARVNDKEVAAIAGSIAASAARFKREIDRAVVLADADKAAARNDAAILIEQANAVKARAENGQPATSEVRDLAEQVTVLQGFVVTHAFPATANWRAVEASLARLQHAFGVSQ
jgi:hypothetical protein